MDFEACEIPMDWKRERDLSVEFKKTLRHIKIAQNEVLLVTEHLTKDLMFAYHYRDTPITKWIFHFLYGTSLCFMSTVLDLEEYIEPIDV